MESLWSWLWSGSAHGLGTWVCCVQSQVQGQFHCLSWHRAWPQKCSEPQLALCRPILGVFGGMFALPEVLTHMISREASGSTKDQKDYWLGPGSTLLGSRQASQNPSDIWALHPARGEIDWSTSWLVPPEHGPRLDLILIPEALEAVLERDVWSQPGSSRAKREQKLASLSLPDLYVYGVTLPRVPHSICFSSLLPSLANEHLITPNNGDVTIWMCLKLVYEVLGEGYSSHSVWGIPQPSLILLSTSSENCTSKALQMVLSFSRMLSVWFTKLMKSLNL